VTVPTKTPLPEHVYVPARPRDTASGRNVGFEMRRQPDGALFLPAYSSVTGLVDALGRHQPWVCVQLTQVLKALDGGRVARVLLDPPVEPQAWRWTQDDLARSGGQPGHEPGGQARPAGISNRVAALISGPSAEREQRP
jgi:hypothetical protein